MSETPEVPKPRPSTDRFGFLTRKLGPAPIWIYAVIIVGVYYWYTHYGPGKSSKPGAGQTMYGYDGNGNPIYQPYYGLDSDGQAIFTPPNATSKQSSSGSTTTTTASGGSKKTIAPKSHASKATAPNFVTVGRWPGKASNGLAEWDTTVSGIAQHEHTSVGEIEKLNPVIGTRPIVYGPDQATHTPDLIYPGEHIRVPGEHTTGNAPKTHPKPAPPPSSKTVTTRWQNNEQTSAPVEAQIGNQQTDANGNVTADIIPHRPLGM